MGSFTIDHNTEIDIHVEDIIDNIKKFDKDELLILKEEIEDNITPLKKRKISIEAETLYDEYKIEILSEFFKKYTLEELKELRKK